MAEPLQLNETDALELMGLLQSMVQFFHNEHHYEDVAKYGHLIYPELRRIFYKTLYNVVPSDVDDLTEFLKPELQKLYKEIDDIYRRP